MAPLVQEQRVPDAGEKDFSVNVKQWGGLPIHTPKMNSHCPFTAILLQINRFLNGYSISFVFEILHSYGIYSKSHYIAAVRFLALKKKKIHMNKRFPQKCLLETHPLNPQCQHFALHKDNNKLGSCNQMGKTCSSQAEGAQDTALLQRQQQPQMVQWWRQESLVGSTSPLPVSANSYLHTP